MGAMSSSSSPVVKDTGRVQVSTASQVIGSAGTAHLVTAANNPAGLLLWHVVISSGAAGTMASNFLVEDLVQDSAGNIYGACEIGLGNGGTGQSHNSISHDCNGILVPAGASLDLVNGGAGGGTALRRCSAVVKYTALV